MTTKRPKSKQPIPKHAKKVFEGVIFDIYQWEQELYDGSKVTFEKAKRPSDSVGVLPITNEGKIILTKQEQPGEEPFIGSIGGRSDPGENPLDTAKREMLEESGFEAEEFVLLHAVHPEIKVDWVCYSYIAKGLKKVESLNLDAGERIELIEVTFNEFMRIILKENFRDLEIALFLLQAKEDKDKFKKIREMFSPV